MAAHRICAICAALSAIDTSDPVPINVTSRPPAGSKITYAPSRKPADSTHLYLRELEAAVLNGQAVVRDGIFVGRRGVGRFVERAAAPMAAV